MIDQLIDQAWDADLDGVRGKYKDYKSYVDDRTGQNTKGPEGYEKDLFTKTNLKLQEEKK